MTIDIIISVQFLHDWSEMEMKWNLLVHIPQITYNFFAWPIIKYNMFVEGSTEKRSM